MAPTYSPPCRRDRPGVSYAIDFDALGAGNYVPSLRYRCALNGRRLNRYNWNLELDDAQLTLVRQIDGARAISDIASVAGWDQSTARAFLWRLWRLDFLNIGWQGRQPCGASGIILRVFRVFRTVVYGLKL
jgi:hypothetical protein